MIYKDSRISEIIMILMLGSLFIPIKFYAVSFGLQIFCLFINLLNRPSVRYSSIILTIIFFMGLSVIFVSNLYIDIKIIIILFFCCVPFSVSSERIIKFCKILILISLFFCVIQLLTKNLFLWQLISQNSGQYESFISGYALFSFVGNPTHAAYLTLCITSILLYFKQFKYVFVGFVLMLFFKNKITLLIFIICSFSFVFFHIKGRFKYYLLITFSVFLLFSYSFIFEHYINSWNDVGDITKIHTIAHRVGVFDLLVSKTSICDILFFGNPGLENYIIQNLSGSAFDSGLLLVISRIGLFSFIILLLLIYMVVFKKNKFLFLIYFLPCLTAVAFYNTSYILPLLFIFRSVCYSNKSQRY